MSTTPSSRVQIILIDVTLPQVRATGALVKFLEKKRIGVELEHPDVRVPILGLKLFSL